MDAILKNETQELVDLLEGKKPIGLKWIYKTKRTPRGTIDRYKCMLVARVYAQQKGID